MIAFLNSLPAYAKPANLLFLPANNQVVSLNLAKALSERIGLNTYLYTAVSGEVQRPVLTPRPAQHGPVPSNHSAIGGLASTAAPSSPPTTAQTTVRELLTNWSELATPQFIAQP